MRQAEQRSIIDSLAKGNINRREPLAGSSHGQSPQGHSMLVAAGSQRVKFSQGLVRACNDMANSSVCDARIAYVDAGQAENRPMACSIIVNGRM